MSFAGPTATLCLLLRIQLPQRTITLCDAGEIDYNGERYTSEDDVFGVVSDFSDYSSGNADEAPAFDLTWSVKNATSAVALTQPEIQGSPVQWRIVSIIRETNAIISDHLIFSGLVDNAEIQISNDAYLLVMGFATQLDRLLKTDKGNRLNRSFHRKVRPGEAGLDLMTGTTINADWGDKALVGSRGGGGGGQPFNPNISRV